MLAQQAVDDQPATHGQQHTLMVSVVMIPVESIHAEVNNYSILPSLVLVSFYGAALIATSLLPILLYKKTRHEWLAISVPVVIDLFLISLPFWSRIG